jgi:hypothetical protein
MAVLSVRDAQTGKRRVQFRSLPNCKNKREAQNECARLITEINSGSYVGTSKATLDVQGVSGARKWGNVL